MPARALASRGLVSSSPALSLVTAGLVEQPANLSTVSAVIGANGGALVLSQALIAVPPGALNADTLLTLTAGDYLLDDNTRRHISPLYTATPEGLTFSLPVLVSMVSDEENEAAQIYWSNASGAYDRLPSTATGKLVSAQVLHFSSGFVGVAVAATMPSTSTNIGGGPEPIPEPSYFINGQIVSQSELQALAEHELLDVAVVDTLEPEVVVDSNEALASVDFIAANAGADVGEPEITVETPEVSASVDGGDDPADPDPRRRG